jgi:flavin reductase (DIM6/NTAB) family NADH-FMN oxidoreductase RutF
MKEYPLAKVFQLLEPGPVVLVSTMSRAGKTNLMTMSWHMMMDFEPPLIACLLSGNNHSFTALVETGECVLAIPDAGLAETVVDIGNCTGARRDKFADFGLTPVPAAQVKPMLVDECFANIECRVADEDFVERYNLFVLEGVRAWRNPRKMGPDLRAPKMLHAIGDGTFRVDGPTRDLKARMVKWPQFV